MGCMVRHQMKGILNSYHKNNKGILIPFVDQKGTKRLYFPYLSL